MIEGRMALRFGGISLAAALLVGSAGAALAASPEASPSPAGSTTPATAGAIPVGTATTLPACTSSAFGNTIIRCENFYTDYWPIITAQLDALYAKAKTVDGGRLVIWDWYARDPKEIAAFNARFPDITVETQGFTYNVSNQIVTAQSTGQRNSDIVSGSITSMTQMYDQGFWANVDWTTFGVPAEFMSPYGYTNLLPDSFNSPLINYNTTKTTSVPSDIQGFNKKAWKNKLGIASYNAQIFTGYGMAKGQDAMTSLINDMLKSKELKITDDADQLLSTGDLSATLAGQLFSPNPDLAVAGMTGSNAYTQFSGVNTYATNPDAAALWVLWYAYDPDLLKTRLSDSTFPSSSEPYPGLPAATFEVATGLAKTNQDAFLQVAQDPTSIFETKGNRDQYNTLIDAANGIFYSQ